LANRHKTERRHTCLPNSFNVLADKYVRAPFCALIYYFEFLVYIRKNLKKSVKGENMAAEIGQNRLISLDVFRGMTIAGMVLVNNPGTWNAIYAPLEHAPWHGITPTDYIFPFFLFIVGIAIPIALGKRLADGITKNVYLKILSRAATIFGLGLLLAAFPIVNLTESNIPMVAKFSAMIGIMATVYFWLVGKNREAIGVGLLTTIFLSVFYFAGYILFFNNFSTLRIPGVLQRIAVCYAVVSILFLHTNWKQLTIIGIALLLFYWLMMVIVPVPGCEITTIDDKACNLAAYLDRMILTENHIWRSAKVFDPEGILSTIPALVTTISGVLTGMWLKTEKSDTEKVGGIFFAGVILCAVGWCWNFFFPFNKALWTSSYVVYTSGLALCFLGFCYWLIDIKGYKNWAKPFVIFGMNALALFVFSGLFGRVLGIIKIAGADGKEVSLQNWIFNTIFLPLALPINASLMYAICFILFCLSLMWLLYRKRIYIKV
jgi:predicted acyltransferase